MITPANGPDKTPALFIKKLQKVNAVSGIRRPARGDDVSISKFSSLIERARSKALSLPDVRTDAVENAREAIKQGKLPKATDIAAAIINHAANGQV